MASANPPRGRFWNRRLRRASFISPSTGERSKRVFTLRDASSRLQDVSGNDESTPLLRHCDEDGDRAAKLGVWRGYVREAWWASRDFWTSTAGLGIIKCSLAYLLGSLATFVPAIAGIIGPSQDSKHMVSSVTVWFHPARTIGSMHEATVLAVIALVYSGVISFTSMGLSSFFGNRDLLLVGHILVLGIFVGGGLGFIAWVKQRLGHPLVNVACSLAALGCITVLIKGGAVQTGAFSEDRVVQVLLMVLMGIIVTTAVNLLVLPVTARSGLGKDLEKTTDLLGEMLISITRAFLSGRKHDLEDDFYKKLAQEHQASLNSMTRNLGEAKREYLMIGKERQYHVMARLVGCLNGLSQDLGGLRSAAFAQFAFVDEHSLSPIRTESSSPTSPRESLPAHNRSKHPSMSMLNSISESPEHEQPGPADEAAASGILSNAVPPSTSNIAPSDVPEALQTPNDMFLAFLYQLGPPTKSLVYTLKQILDDLPFKKAAQETRWVAWMRGPSHEVAVNEQFISSLKDAITLYSESRRQALNTLYENRALKASFTDARNLTKSQAPKYGNGSKDDLQNESDEVLADIEEVTACCGHFSFSLLDFAQDVLTFLALLEELREEMAKQSRSWTWLLFWQGRQFGDPPAPPYKAWTLHPHDEEHDVAPGASNPLKKADELAIPKRSAREKPWSYQLYRIERFMCRDDVRYAIKVGIGAIVYSLPAFLESSRPFFVKWRGEWGLVSYMAICCMTIGASNTTGINRIIGTLIGAGVAVIAWVVSNSHGEANPFLLGFLGWLVSIGCFYLILVKGNGPMGRFILLTYNLGALYSYSLSIRDDDNDDDEGGIDPSIWKIAMHRCVAVIAGCLFGIVVTRLIWPISARTKLKDGLCILWLRMSLIWKRDPLAMFLLGEPCSRYMDIREESSLHAFLASLQTLRQAANSEFELRGPFPSQETARILDCTGRMLDAFHAMNVVISKDLQYTPGEAAVLRYTRPERFELSARISHLYSVLASSIKLEYPLNDVLPSIDHTRDRLLGKLSKFRTHGEGRELANEQDYEMIYAYVLVTGQLSQEIRSVSQEIEYLFGSLNEEHLKLQ